MLILVPRYRKHLSSCCMYKEYQLHFKAPAFCRNVQGMLVRQEKLQAPVHF